jgi:hypothetical protein
MIRDHMEARFWAEDGGSLATGVHSFWRDLKLAFARLHAIEFAAPWRRRTRPTGC